MRDTVEAHSEDVQSDVTDSGDIAADAASADTTVTESGFAALGLRPELLKALDELGYEEPTPIQRETIPYLMAGKDLLGQAATGTGKTAAFALPALQLIDGRAAFDARVDASYRNRTLSRSDVTRLRSDYAALIQLETSYARDGISAREQSDLQLRLDDLNRRVGDNYDGGYGSGDNYGSDPRGAQIEARIVAGERSGAISRTEAASLRQELRDLTRRWTELEARVEQARR